MNNVYVGECASQKTKRERKEHKMEDEELWLQDDRVVK